MTEVSVNEKAARRRDEVLDAAAEVFARQGYRQTDVQVIADALGIGKGTIYRCFPTKEDLFLAAVDRAMRRLQEQVQIAVSRSENPLEQVKAAMVAHLAFFDRQPMLAELLIQERAEFTDREKPSYFQYRDANLDRWRGIFRDLIESGAVRRVDVEVILDLITAALYGSIFTARFAGSKRSFEQRARGIVDVIFRGILLEGAGPSFNGGLRQ